MSWLFAERRGIANILQVSREMNRNDESLVLAA